MDAEVKILYSTDTVFFFQKDLKDGSWPLLYPIKGKLSPGKYLVYNPTFNVVEMEFEVSEKENFDLKMIWYKTDGNYGIRNSNWYRIEVFQEGELKYMLQNWWWNELKLDLRSINKRHKAILKKMKLKHNPL